MYQVTKNFGRISYVVFTGSESECNEFIDNNEGYLIDGDGDEWTLELEEVNAPDTLENLGLSETDFYSCSISR